MEKDSLIRSSAEVQRFCEDLLAKRFGTNMEQVAAYVLKVEGPRHCISRERLRLRRRGLK
jgi:hypothetical protein